MNPEIDTEAITRAVREYNAAENSLRRAHERLRAAIPEGLTVLHKLLGDTSVPVYYWTYRSGKGEIYEGASRDEYDGQAIIIEAPARRAEFLPPLEG